MGKKAVDMTGMVIGLLTVVERKLVEGPRGGKHSQWVCRCECGNMVVKDAGDLRRAKFMSCGCVKGKPSARKDHTGVRYGKATGICETGEVKFSQRVWLWRCDCGKNFEATAGNFVYDNYSPGCPDCTKASMAKATGDRARVHGMCKTKEWKAWSKVKDRVLNPNNPDYSVYSELGIDDDFAESFEAFYQEIGPCPDDGMRYSVDRIDNTIGYRKNNIRWATDVQQARNKGMMSNNTSGYTGVHIENKIHRNGVSSTTYAVAQWHDLNGNICKKSFSFKKYGEELALLCAIEARDQAIRLLNMQGAGYTENHGK